MESTSSYVLTDPESQSSFNKSENLGENILPDSQTEGSEMAPDSDIQKLYNMLRNQNFTFIQPLFLYAESTRNQEAMDVRSFQRQIFENGRNTNCIISLETGTGKTATAVLLSAFYLAQKATSQKKVVFLAPTIPLVDQQAGYVRRTLPQVFSFIQEYTGTLLDMRNLYTVRVHSKADPSTHNRTRWKIFMKTVSIFFMVPDCLITCLRRGLMRMSDISCLIFDECHHAEGDQTYNLIMREFYHSSFNHDEGLPHIVGLTACPVIEKNTNAEVLFNQMVTLCVNLGSNFVAYDQNSINQYVKEAKIDILKYQPEIEGEEFKKYIRSINLRSFDQIQNQLTDKFTPYAKAMARIDSFDKVQQKLAIEAVEQLYRFSAQEGDQQQPSTISTTLLKLVNQLQKSMRKIISKLILEVGMCGVHLFLCETLKSVKGFTDSVTIFDCTQQNNLISKEIHSFVEDLIEYFAPYASAEISNLSAKAQKLVEDLKISVERIQDQNMTVILVFVYERMTAHYLEAILSKFVQANMEGKIDSGIVMGHNANNFRSKPRKIEISVEDEDQLLRLRAELRQSSYYSLLLEELEQKQSFSEQMDPEELFDIPYSYQTQAITIGRFRCREFQLLVTTSITEEGFNIPVCNVVYSYNQINSYRRFIQMRGRARRQDSRFVLITPDQMYQECREDVEQLLLQNRIIKEAQQKLSTNFNMIQIRDYYKQNIERNLQISYLDYYLVEKTGVVLTTFWAHLALNDFKIALWRSMAAPKSTMINIKTIVPKIRQKNKYCALVLLPIILRDYMHFFETQNILFDVKKDAKKAAELFTVRRLHELGYFDDYLTPIFSKRTLNFFNLFDEEDFLSFVSAENKIKLQKLCYSVYDQQRRLKNIYRMLGNDELRPTQLQANLQYLENFYLYRVYSEGLECQLGFIFHKDTLHNYTCQFQLQNKLCKLQLVKEKFGLNVNQYNRIAQVDALLVCWNLEALDKEEEEEHLELLSSGIIEQPQHSRCLRLAIHGNQTTFASRRLNIVFLNQAQSDLDWEKIDEVNGTYAIESSDEACIEKNPLQQPSQVEACKFLIKESLNIRDNLNRKHFEAQFSFLFENNMQNQRDVIEIHQTQHILAALYEIVHDENKRKHHCTLNVGKSLYKLFVSMHIWHQLSSKLKIHLELYQKRKRLEHESFIKMQCAVICNLHLYLFKADEKTNHLRTFLAPSIDILPQISNDQFEKEFRTYKIQDTQNDQHLKNSYFANALYSILQCLQQLPDQQSQRLCTLLLKQLQVIDPELLQQAMTHYSYRKTIIESILRAENKGDLTQKTNKSARQDEEAAENEYIETIFLQFNNRENSQIQQQLDAIQQKSIYAQFEDQDPLTFLGSSLYEYFIARLIARTAEFSSCRCKLLQLVLCSLVTQAYLCFEKNLESYLILDQSESGLKSLLEFYQKQQLKSKSQSGQLLDPKFYHEQIIKSKKYSHALRTAQNTLRALLGAILQDCDFNYSKAELIVSALLEKDIKQLINSNCIEKFPQSAVLEKWPQDFENCELKRTDLENHDKPTLKFYILCDGEGKLLYSPKIEAFCKVEAWWRLAERLKPKVE